MKRKILLFICAFCVLNYCRSQEYELIKEIFADRQIFLSPNFIPMSYGFRVQEKPFNEEMLKDLWYPIARDKTPNIELFLDNISIEHLNNFTSKKDTSKINFKKFGKNINKIIDLDKHLKTGGVVTNISKPFVSCNNEWVVILIYSYNNNTSGDGFLDVYKRINDKWLLYRRMTAFFSS